MSMFLESTTAIGAMLLLCRKRMFKGKVEIGSHTSTTTLPRVQGMDVEVSLTKKVSILGLDNRTKENLAWCAASYGINRLYWIDGYLFCMEVYDKSFEEEIKKKEFPISQICYVKSPKYEKLYEIDKSFQIPVANVSDMTLFQSILKAILEHEKSCSKNP